MIVSEYFIVSSHVDEPTLEPLPVHIYKLKLPFSNINRNDINMA